MTLKRTTPLQRSGGRMKPGKPLKARGATKAKKAARYKAFLSSAVWKRIRKAALERAGFQCERIKRQSGALCSFAGRPLLGVFREVRCPNEEKLTVHHLTYARFGGDELPTDLQVLCKSCHDTVEALKGRRIA